MLLWAQTATDARRAAQRGRAQIRRFGVSKLVRVRLVCFSVFVLGAMAVGSALHLPAMAAERLDQYVAPLVSSTCSSTSACLSEQNNGAGPGITAISAKGQGANAETKFNSTSASNGKAGLLGQDLSTSGKFDQGVLGTSKRGTGIEGTSNSGVGVVGTSTSSYGVEALSSGQTALFARSTFGDGVQSIALGNDGTNSSTQNNSTTAGVGRSGIWGHDDSTDGGHLNVGVAGSSTTGLGMSASSFGFVGLSVAGGGYVPDQGDDVPALSISAGSGGPAFLIQACANASDNPCTTAKGSKVFVLDNAGNIMITGSIYTAGACNSGCAKTRNGNSRRVVSYADSQTVPSMEDFGEAQLVNGRAYVRLSADFANVVDQNASYLVFITPEGDSRGLYVTQKTRAGFEVRENGDGKSTLAFSYRIVAKPLGANAERLPFVTNGVRGHHRTLPG